MPANKTILVIGATGGQGSAVARRLLDDGWVIRVLLRRNKAFNAEVVIGDLDDRASLQAAAQGVHGVFSMLPADFTAPDPELEVRRGKNVADAAHAAGAHLVYSSVGGADRKSGIAHFETKAEIEAYLDAIGVRSTVLRPTFFMENWHYLLPPATNGERVGQLALDPETRLQMIAVTDIGRIAADAFTNPAEYIGRKLDIAGDELTVRQIAELFTRAHGIPTRFTWHRPAVAEFAKMYDWLNNEGHRADIPTLRARYPELLTLRSWLTQAQPGIG